MTRPEGIEYLVNHGWNSEEAEKAIAEFDGDDCLLPLEEIVRALDYAKKAVSIPPLGNHESDKMEITIPA